MPSKTELAIAGFYDGIYLFYELVNSLLTFGLDLYWRARAARLAVRAAPAARLALDVCCGTGDFSRALQKAFGPGLAVTGTDLSEAMLSVARAKTPGAAFLKAEAKELPFPDGSFDLVTISFATRNLNIDRPLLLAALREFRRVLKPGGVFLQVETTQPANPVLRFLMHAYVRLVIGLLNLLSPKSRSSYTFLKNTILNFYPAAAFDGVLLEAGFTSASHTILCPGPVAVHTAVL
ncbi:MAG: ubiquinone/menaquinone biosynthesis methyltransferase [Elusimicrobiales bacterium]|nr:ubiquinone/menaquinone biosynthesis methyltransferase [Elusimicrobiales bacterium]